MKKIALGILSLILTYWLVQYWPVVIHVKGKYPEDSISIRMPLKDKKRLEFFFRYVSFLEVWAYTSIGHKPMSVGQYTKPFAQFCKAMKSPYLKDFLFAAFCPPNMHEICYLLNPEKLKVHLGWKTFNKYLSYFSDSRFAFFTYSMNDSVCMSIIDKMKLYEIINYYQSEFCDELRSSGLKVEDLLKNEYLYFFLKNLRNDYLYGILLGYGKNNAMLFSKSKGCSVDPIRMVSMWESEGEEWIAHINQKDRSFEAWDTSDLFYPQFCCDANSEETQQLARIYKEDREQIVQYYNGQDIVEATFSIFNQKLKFDDIPRVIQKLGNGKEAPRI